MNSLSDLPTSTVAILGITVTPHELPGATSSDELTACLWACSDSRHKRPVNRVSDVSFVVNDKGNIKDPICWPLWRESINPFHKQPVMWNVFQCQDVFVVTAKFGCLIPCIRNVCTCFCVSFFCWFSWYFAILLTLTSWHAFSGESHQQGYG